MNIAIVTTWFPAGAGYVSKAYRSTFEERNKVFIYARGGQEMRNDPKWDDDMVTWAPLNYHREIDVKHFIKWLKKHKIDVIFFNEQRYWEPVIQAKKEGFTIGAYIDYYTEDMVPLFEAYDFLICNTKRHYSVFNWHSNCYYIPWGTDNEIFKPNEGTHDDQTIFLISLGWAGMYRGDRKGLIHAAKAFKNVSGNCKMKIYSQISLENCIQEWQELIGMDARIEFVVGTYDPFPFHEGDIYVYPSRLDGIGLSLPEALSSGLAAITTDNAPMNEFVIDNYNGRLVEVERFISRPDGYYWPQSVVSEKSLTGIMQWYVDNSTALANHKLNAREDAVVNLNWAKNSVTLNDLVKKVKNKGEVSDRVILACIREDRKKYPSIMYRGLALFRDILSFNGLNIRLPGFLNKFN